MAKLQDITPQEALRTTCPSQSVLPHPLEDPSISCPITRQLSSCVIKMEPQWAENEVNWSLTEIKFQRWGFTWTKRTLKRLLTLEQLQIKPHRLRSCPKCIFIHIQTVSNSTAVPLWIDMHFRPNKLFKKLLNGSQLIVCWLYDSGNATLYLSCQCSSSEDIQLQLNSYSSLFPCNSLSW